uniref:Uncharacterized protein n=1 Tax=Arundo donax TaxID=35708 RepID=A0A0A8Y9M0_ARUDO
MKPTVATCSLRRLRPRPRQWSSDAGGGVDAERSGVPGFAEPSERRRCSLRTGSGRCRGYWITVRTPASTTASPPLASAASLSSVPRRCVHGLRLRPLLRHLLPRPPRRASSRAAVSADSPFDRSFASTVRRQDTPPTATAKLGGAPDSAELGAAWLPTGRA